MTAYTATLIEMPVVSCDFLTVTDIGYAHFAAAMLEVLPPTDAPSYGVLYPPR